MNSLIVQFEFDETWATYFDKKYEKTAPELIIEDAIRELATGVSIHIPDSTTEQHGGIDPMEVIKKAYEQTENFDVADTEITEEKGVRAYQIINEMQDILGIFLEGEYELWKSIYKSLNPRIQG